MFKSLKIIISGKVAFLEYANFLANKAIILEIQGSVQRFDQNKLLVYATGDADKVESFIDALYVYDKSSEIDDVDIKPLDENKDFRGVFRIIQ